MRKQLEKITDCGTFWSSKQFEPFNNVSAMKDPHTCAHAHTHTHTPPKHRQNKDSNPLTEEIDNYEYTDVTVIFSF